MKDYDVLLHVKGESEYTADRAEKTEMLHIAILASSSPHAKISAIQKEDAEHTPGVAGIFTAKDIPGKNQIGNIIEDEPLLAEKEVHYIGQPIAIVVAETKEIAKKAAGSIQVIFEEMPPVLSPREAHSKNRFIAPPRIFSLGDAEKAWADCDVVVEGTVESGGQEHLYLETQNAFAKPKEGGGIKIHSSTQSPTAVQKTTAQILGVPMHQVEVDVLRLGGGFGGKEDQATPYATMSALAAFLLKKPVQISLNRSEDILLTGKRHPYSSDFKIGLKKDGTILAYDVKFYQNSGAAADLSTAILERTLFHTTGSYFIPNVRAYAAACRTNLAPNTAYRGFGGPQAMFVLESAIYRAAERLGVDPIVIQQKNLTKAGDEFPYGMKNLSDNAIRCFEEADQKYHIADIKNRAQKWNEDHPQSKKGVAVMPLCFGISFTSTFLNQASALVHVYNDGSVGVSTGAIEMGQGVNAKIREVIARVFSINIERIKNESTNTTRNANTSPTAASSGADLNGNATKLACEEIIKRLKAYAASKLGATPEQIEIKNEKVLCAGKETAWNWSKLVNDVYFERIGLSCLAHYATPNIFFDKTKEKGNAFAYHTFGTAIAETTLDCLRGTYSVDSVKIIHDAGQTLNETIDRGQIEGALLQGIGWLTMEELVYGKNGKLLTKDLSSYKIPDIYSAPEEISIDFLKASDYATGPFNSKAIGEPPFMYGIAAYFSLLNAIKAFKPEAKAVFDAPLTPEKVFLSLYN
ncbi:MAG: molybdopterin cofactor-binding domain-containing protein [Candidatus Paceibacterota bacterium]|jgi:xanthine dehydrogenase large subunit